MLTSHLLAIVSHELRTPVSAIKGSIGLLLSEDFDDFSEDSRALLDISRRNVERLEKMLDDIIDLDTVSAVEFSVKNEVFDLSGIVISAVELIENVRCQFDISIKVDFGTGTLNVEADSNRLMQILLNILSNACKFSNRGGTVSVYVSELPESILCTVTNGGEGISHYDKDKIFEPFTNLSNSNRKQFGGSGLGLSICKALIERMSGSIWFESTVDVGTQFNIALPKPKVFDLETV